MTGNPLCAYENKKGVDYLRFKKNKITDITASNQDHSGFGHNNQSYYDE